MKIRDVGLHVLVLVVCVACAQRVVLRPSSHVPAAEATAKITRDANDNAKILLKVSYLAFPERLNPPRSVYVVWAETPQGRTINLGRLRIGKRHQGTFEGRTSLHEFRVFITAEDIAAASTPSQQVVFVTDVVRVKKGWW
jgi:hypothetical protein